MMANFTPTPEQFLKGFSPLIQKFGMQIFPTNGLVILNEHVRFTLTWNEMSIYVMFFDLSDGFQAGVENMIFSLYPSLKSKYELIHFNDNYIENYLKYICNDIEQYCSFLITGEKNVIYDLYKQKRRYGSKLISFLMSRNIFDLKSGWSGGPEWVILALQELKERGIELPEELKDSPFDV